MTLEMAVALQDSACLGPQIQGKNIERNTARVIAGDVPENVVETLLAPVSLASVSLARLRQSAALASLALASLAGDGRINELTSWKLTSWKKGHQTE